MFFCTLVFCCGELCTTLTNQWPDLVLTCDLFKVVMWTGFMDLWGYWGRCRNWMCVCGAEKRIVSYVLFRNLDAWRNINRPLARFYSFIFVIVMKSWNDKRRWLHEFSLFGSTNRWMCEVVGSLFRFWYVEALHCWIFILQVCLECWTGFYISSWRPALIIVELEVQRKPVLFGAFLKLWVDD